MQSTISRRKTALAVGADPNAKPSDELQAERDMSLADEVRARMQAHRQGEKFRGGMDARLGSTGGGFPSIFNRFDLVVFAVLLGLLYWAVKREFGVDLLEKLWDIVRPQYDHL